MLSSRIHRVWEITYASSDEKLTRGPRPQPLPAVRQITLLGILSCKSYPEFCSQNQVSSFSWKPKMRAIPLQLLGHFILNPYQTLLVSCSVIKTKRGEKFCMIFFNSPRNISLVFEVNSFLIVEVTLVHICGFVMTPVTLCIFYAEQLFAL